MTIERFETPLARHAKIDGWGLEPIRRVDGGVIDYGYYLDRGRQARGRAVLDAMQALVRRLRQSGSWAAGWVKPRHAGPISGAFRKMRLTRV